MAQALKQHLLLTANYNKWAHGQISTFCRHQFAKYPELYTKSTDLSLGTVRNMLCHLWMAEQLWFCRIIGGTHRDLKLPHTIPRTIDMHEFATFWTRKHEKEGKFDSFFEGISDELLSVALSKSADNWIEFVTVQSDDDELCQEVTYFDCDNKRSSITNNIAVNQVMNHSSYHRGQISAAVALMCPKAPKMNLDFIDWHNLQRQPQMHQTLG